MSFNAAALKMMADKGLSAHDIAEIAEANEQRKDATATERKRRQRAREAMSRVTSRCDTVPPNDNILTPSVSEKPKPKGLVKKSAYPAPAGVPDEVWEDFLSSPKRYKAGMSKTAYSGICNNLLELAEHGYPPGEMIALAVERGWTTVKLEWVKNDERSSRKPTDSYTAEAWAILDRDCA